MVVTSTVESESYTLECSGEFWRAPDDAVEAREIRHEIKGTKELQCVLHQLWYKSLVALGESTFCTV
jgi:hypothetical protein